MLHLNDVVLDEGDCLWKSLVDGKAPDDAQIFTKDIVW